MLRDDITFDEARTGLLEACAEAEGWTWPEAVRAYNGISEFRRRIDLAALNMSCPASMEIH